MQRSIDTGGTQAGFAARLRILALALLLPAFAFAQGGAPTANPRLASLGIEVWPEYDRPAALVILKGTLAEGADADITVIHPELAWTVDVKAFCSRGKNSPFHGHKMKGRAVLTIVNGTIKYDGLASNP